jgi:hypothetical protein
MTSGESHVAKLVSMFMLASTLIELNIECNKS